ncbi:hypothetical protein L6452_20919 [Arctium lappa]|uniref:Uncharacterized protein n=1 Tax=Arctium lappa TaxID=4217 RepID=A0ACB9BD92_ARCLA|nr:hypothetical protein L6452_20919 [Arctium lappa]
MYSSTHKETLIFSLSHHYLLINNPFSILLLSSRRYRFQILYLYTKKKKIGLGRAPISIQIFNTNSSIYTKISKFVCVYIEF